jgi:hypothetical protein
MVRTRFPTTKKARRTRKHRTEDKKHCLFCLRELSNGELTCDEICEDKYWRLVPTIKGDIWEPKRPPIGSNLQPSHFAYGAETSQQSPLADLW